MCKRGKKEYSFCDPIPGAYNFMEAFIQTACCQVSHNIHMNRKPHISMTASHLMQLISLMKDAHLISLVGKACLFFQKSSHYENLAFICSLDIACAFPPTNSNHMDDDSDGYNIQ